MLLCAIEHSLGSSAHITAITGARDLINDINFMWEGTESLWIADSILRVVEMTRGSKAKKQRVTEDAHLC